MVSISSAAFIVRMSSIFTLTPTPIETATLYLIEALTIINYPATEQRGIPKRIERPKGRELHPERLIYFRLKDCCHEEDFARR
jgi:hypothetical protein